MLTPDDDQQHLAATYLLNFYGRRKGIIILSHTALILRPVKEKIISLLFLKRGYPVLSFAHDYTLTFKVIIWREKGMNQNKSTALTSLEMLPEEHFDKNHQITCILKG